MSDGSSISERKSSSDPPFREASPFGRRPREVVLSNDWSVHDFLIDMSDEVFSRLRPHFKFLTMCPLGRATVVRSAILGVR